MKCKDHPDAPHGFDRNASHSLDRYVCECEFWEPPLTPKDFLLSNYNVPDICQDNDDW